MRTYPQNGVNVEIKAVQGYGFQMSNSLSQLASRESAFSKIDLGECESKIKATNGLDSSASLIFLKFENIQNSENQRDIQ